ncbi:hypothetical protein BDV96DRAFT_583443 [Lophiotrema nucula]|uniref:Secreted protein n=1 Tax=Lophiotrema nucula TaxID=690887 RepID=A0A6A5YU12_9PLEO|nr:hypothetical protein BDV96DRAFT_583443 [Lophiotrema nucula]
MFLLVGCTLFPLAEAAAWMHDAGAQARLPSTFLPRSPLLLHNAVPSPMFPPSHRAPPFHVHIASSFELGSLLWRGGRGLGVALLKYPPAGSASMGQGQWMASV